MLCQYSVRSLSVIPTVKCYFHFTHLYPFCYFTSFQQAQFWVLFFCEKNWSPKNLQVSFMTSSLQLHAPERTGVFIQFNVHMFICLNLYVKPFKLPCLFLERFGLSFLGCILTIGGTYLFVAFGPNSHEKVNGENIVRHIVAWPVLVYLVRYLTGHNSAFRLR